MKKLNLLTLLVTVLFVFSACKKEEKREAPTVSTLAAVEITTNSARLKAVVENENEAAVTSRGFCWSFNPNPGLNDYIVNSGFGPGDYDAKLHNLNPGGVYYYKAFAINANGTSFGQELSFTTDSALIFLVPYLRLKDDFGYTFNDTTIQVDSTIKVGVIAGHEIDISNELSRFKFSIVSNNISTTWIDTTFSSVSFDWETDLKFTGVGQAKLLFEIWDKLGIKNDKSFDVVLDDPGAAVNKFANVEFGSWNDTEGSFFSSNEGVIYNIPQTYQSPVNQAKIDFLYFYGQTNRNTMASPDDVDANAINDLKLNLWTTRNQTRFNPSNITVAQFDAIGDTYKFPAFDFGAQTTKMNNLKVNDIFMFKTKNDKLGLVKITYLSQPNKGDTSKATIIVQK